MTLTIFNDVHLGANRTGGTTPTTAWQLRQDLLKRFGELLAVTEGDMMLLGDLFDGAQIPRADFTTAFAIIYQWVARTTGHLWLVAGNHDLSKNSTQMSDFQGLANMLVGLFPERVTYIEGAAMTPYGYVISHVPNQALFDIELAKVPACPLLFVHCNYDNHFAQESDHSLNLSQEQAEKLPVTHIIFAHEHQSRVELDDKVVIIGNQIASSVSDCLGNKTKHCLKVDLPSGGEPQLEFVQVWEAAGDYSEQDWRELKDEGRFIRITGEATSAEADQVVRALAQFRRSAQALVITNAVKIEGVADAAQIELSHEQIQNFNVLEALFEILSEDEVNKIKLLLKDT